MSLLILALLLAAPPAAPQGPPSSVEGMEPAPGVPSLLQSGVPAIPPELKSRTGQYLNARAASLADVSEDGDALLDRKSTRLNSSHGYISYAVFCLKKKKRIPSGLDGVSQTPESVVPR